MWETFIFWKVKKANVCTMFTFQYARAASQNKIEIKS